MFHKIVHMLNWIKTNLFANMDFDLSAITWSCTDSVWVLTLFGFISRLVYMYVLSHKLNKLSKQ